MWSCYKNPITSQLLKSIKFYSARKRRLKCGINGWNFMLQFEAILEKSAKTCRGLLFCRTLYRLYRLHWLMNNMWGLWLAVVWTSLATVNDRGFSISRGVVFVTRNKWLNCKNLNVSCFLTIPTINVFYETFWVRCQLQKWAKWMKTSRSNYAVGDIMVLCGCAAEAGIVRY